MPGVNYCRRLRSLLLYLCYVFRALINSLVCRSGPRSVSDLCALNAKFPLKIIKKKEDVYVLYIYSHARLKLPLTTRFCRSLCWCDSFLALINSLVRGGGGGRRRRERKKEGRKEGRKKKKT